MFQERQEKRTKGQEGLCSTVHVKSCELRVEVFNRTSSRIRPASSRWSSVLLCSFVATYQCAFCFTLYAVHAFQYCWLLRNIAPSRIKFAVLLASFRGFRLGWHFGENDGVWMDRRSDKRCFCGKLHLLPECGCHLSVACKICCAQSADFTAWQCSTDMSCLSMPFCDVGIHQGWGWTFCLQIQGESYLKLSLIPTACCRRDMTRLQGRWIRLLIFYIFCHNVFRRTAWKDLTFLRRNQIVGPLTWYFRFLARRLTDRAEQWRDKNLTTSLQVGRDVQCFLLFLFFFLWKFNFVPIVSLWRGVSFWHWWAQDFVWSLWDVFGLEAKTWVRVWMLLTFWSHPLPGSNHRSAVPSDCAEVKEKRKMTYDTFLTAACLSRTLTCPKHPKALSLSLSLAVSCCPTCRRSRRPFSKPVCVCFWSFKIWSQFHRFNICIYIYVYIIAASLVALVRINLRIIFRICHSYRLPPFISESSSFSTLFCFAILPATKDGTLHRTTPSGWDLCMTCLYESTIFNMFYTVIIRRIVMVRLPLCFYW